MISFDNAWQENEVPVFGSDNFQKPIINKICRIFQISSDIHIDGIVIFTIMNATNSRLNLY